MLRAHCNHGLAKLVKLVPMAYQSTSDLAERNRFKRSNLLLIAILLGVIFATLLPTSSFAITKNEIAPITDTSIQPKAYIVVDAISGTVIKSKDEHEALPVASVSKIVTALGAISTIEANKPIPATAEAQAVEPMKIGMSVGEIWKRDDLINCLLMISANDAAYALATASAGSIEEFVKTQNAIAKNLGMKESTFGDPSGLDDSAAINGFTKMSAYDVAIASRAVLNHEELSQIVAKKDYQFTGGDGVLHTLTNHNDKILEGYQGATGLKTGYTAKSGRTIVTSATRDGHSVIAVVLDVQETDQWAAQLMNDGFDYLAKAERDKTDLTKSKNKLPEVRPISTEQDLAVLIEPKSNKSRKVALGKTSNKDSGLDSVGNYLSTTNISLFIIALIVLVLYLRVRSVKKRRELRRIARLRAREIERRRMLDLIDLTSEEESELISKK